MEKEKVTTTLIIGVKAIYNNGELIYADPTAIAIMNDFHAEHSMQKLKYEGAATESRH